MSNKIIKQFKDIFTKPENKKRLVLGTVIFAILGVIISMLLSFIPSPKIQATIKPEVNGVKENAVFNHNTEPTFIVDSNGLIPVNESKKGQGELKIGQAKVSAEVSKLNNTVKISPEIESLPQNQDEFKIKIPLTPQFSPGKYHLSVNLNTLIRSQTVEQDFTWGVLAMNFDQSSYKIDETVQIGMAVLDDEGHTLCDAALTLSITDPASQTTTLSTADQSIVVSDECQDKNVTNKPDYSALFTPKIEGEYKVGFKAETANGLREMTESFEVKNNPDFVIKRYNTSMRIYPYSVYAVNINVLADKDLTGGIKEKIPASFEIKNISAGGGITAKDGIAQTISWPASLKAGESINLSYEYDAPDISPQFYLLGPIEIWQDNSVIFTEPRTWQIAADITLPTYKASGTFTAGAAAITPPYPTGAGAPVANDIALLVVESENQAISLTTANGFVELGDQNNKYAGTAAVDPASRLAVYWKRCAGGDSAPVVADSGNHQTGRIHLFSGVKTSGNPWNAYAEGNDSAANDQTGVIPGATTTIDNTLVVLISTSSYNATSTTEFSAWTNGALGSVAEVSGIDNTDTIQLGGGHGMATGTKAIAGLYGNTTVTLAHTSYKGAMSIALEGGISISGNIYATGSESTLDTAAFTIAVSVNNAAPTTFAASGGSYTVSGISVSSGNSIAVYIQGNAKDANTFTVTDGATNIANLHLYVDKVAVGNDNGAGTTQNSNICTQITSPGAGDTLIACSGNNLTINSGKEFHILTGEKYDTGATATLTTQGAAGDFHVDDSSQATFSSAGVISGAVSNDASAILTIGTTNTLSVGGNWTNAGTFTANSSTVTFNGTAAGKTINTGGTGAGKDFYNLTFNGTGGAWSPLTNTTTVTNDLTMTAGTFNTTTGTANVVVNGNVQGTLGVISMTSTNTFEQRVASNKNFGTTSGSAIWNFYNLTFSRSAGTPTITTQSGGNGSVNVSNVLSVSKAGDGDATLFNPANRVWTLSGIGTPLTFPIAGSDLTASSSSFRYTGGNGATTITASTNYNHLLVYPSGATATHTFAAGGNFTIGGVLYLGGNSAPAGHAVSLGTSNVTAKNNVTICRSTCSNDVAFTPSSNTFTWSPIGTQTWIDNDSTKQNLGIVSITGGTSTPRIYLNQLSKATSVFVDTGHELLLQSYTLTLVGNTTPFSVSGTFTPQTGAIEYAPAATTGVNVASTTYHDVIFNKASNVFSLQAGGITTDADGDLTITAGELDTVNTQNYPITVGGNWSNSGTFTPRAGTVTFNRPASTTQTLDSGGITAGKIFNNLTHSGAGTLQLINNAINIDGVFTNSNGTFDANGLNMNVADDFLASGGSFSAGGTPGTQTVTFDGTNEATVSGSTTFNNLTMDSSAGAKTIKFTAAETQTISNGKTWTLAGALGKVLTLKSTADTEAWYFVIFADMNSGSYIDVRDSQNITNAFRITADVDCNDLGNNDPGWLFATKYSYDTLTTDAVSYPNLNDIITIDNAIVNNHTGSGLTATYIDYVIFIDTSLNGIPDGVEQYADNGCTDWKAWGTGGGYTFRKTGLDVAAHTTVNDNAPAHSCANNSFPQNTTYTLWAKWWDGASTTYATKYTTFTSIPTLNEILFLILIFLAVFWAYKTGRLKLWRKSKIEPLKDNGSFRFAPEKKDILPKNQRYLDSLSSKRRGPPNF